MSSMRSVEHEVVNNVRRFIVIVRKLQLHSNGEFPPTQLGQVEGRLADDDDVMRMVAWVKEKPSVCVWGGGCFSVSSNTIDD